MAFDGFFVRKLVEEFNESILYSRIKKNDKRIRSEYFTWTYKQSK